MTGIDWMKLLKVCMKCQIEVTIAIERTVSRNNRKGLWILSLKWEIYIEDLLSKEIKVYISNS